MPRKRRGGDTARSLPGAAPATWEAGAAALSETPAPFAACDQLNFTARPRCGTQKCFVHVKDDASTGYMVSYQSHVGACGSADTFASMQEGTAVARRTLSAHGIAHFLRGEPQRVWPPACVVRALRDETRGYPPFSERCAPESRVGEGFVVQRTAMAPTPHLILKAVFQHFNEVHLLTFLRNHVANETAFALEFARSVERTRAMVREEVCLAQDFQMLLAESGTLYNIDLDRVLYCACVTKEYPSRAPEFEQVALKIDTALRALSVAVAKTVRVQSDSNDHFVVDAGGTGVDYDTYEVDDNTNDDEDGKNDNNKDSDVCYNL